MLKFCPYYVTDRAGWSITVLAHTDDEALSMVLQRAHNHGRLARRDAFTFYMRRAGVRWHRFRVALTRDEQP